MNCFLNTIAHDTCPWHNAHRYLQQTWDHQVSETFWHSSHFQTSYQTVICVNMGSAFIDHGKAKPDAGTLITKWQVATGRSSRICSFVCYVTNAVSCLVVRHFFSPDHTPTIYIICIFFSTRKSFCWRGSVWDGHLNVKASSLRLSSASAQPPDGLFLCSATVRKRATSS